MLPEKISVVKSDKLNSVTMQLLKSYIRGTSNVGPKLNGAAPLVKVTAHGYQPPAEDNQNSIPRSLYHALLSK